MLTINSSLHLTIKLMSVTVTKINIIRTNYITMAIIKTIRKNKDLKRVKVNFKTYKAHIVNYKGYGRI